MESSYHDEDDVASSNSGGLFEGSEIFNQSHYFLASIASIMSDGNALVLDCDALLCECKGQWCCTMLNNDIWSLLKQSTAAVTTELFPATCL